MKFILIQTILPSKLLKLKNMPYFCLSKTRYNIKILWILIYIFSISIIIKICLHNKGVKI